MNDIAMLDYTFLFDPIETGYTNVFQFENDLNLFFQSKDIESNVVKNVEGGGNRRIIQLTKKIEPIEEPIQPEKTIKQRLYQFRANKGPDGKFRNV